MSAHEDDAGVLCPVCGVTFDCHEVLSPKCGGEVMEDLSDVPSRGDQAVDRAEYKRLSWEGVRDRLLHDDFGGDGTPPARQRQRWLDVRAALERVEEQGGQLALLMGKINDDGSLTTWEEHVDILDDAMSALNNISGCVEEQERLRQRVEELEREKAELLPGVDALHRRIKGLERERDEWRDTARSEMAGRAAAEAAIASLEDNADVWEQRALKAEAEFASLLRTYNAAAQAWGRDEAALTAERARLEALLDVSERKLGEWRDRGAELERLRVEAAHASAEIRALRAPLAPAQPEEESQDSPDFRPKELDEFAARGFERINRRAPEVK